jgi:hypothetical protein
MSLPSRLVVCKSENPRHSSFHVKQSTSSGWMRCSTRELELWLMKGLSNLNLTFAPLESISTGNQLRLRGTADWAHAYRNIRSTCNTQAHIPHPSFDPTPAHSQSPHVCDLHAPRDIRHAILSLQHLIDREEKINRHPAWRQFCVIEALSPFRACTGMTDGARKARVVRRGGRVS